MGCCPTRFIEGGTTGIWDQIYILKQPTSELVGPRVTVVRKECRSGPSEPSIANAKENRHYESGAEPVSRGIARIR